MADIPKFYCPVAKCDRREYDSLEAVQVHLKKAQTEGDQNHIDIAELEGWDEKPLDMN